MLHKITQKGTIILYANTEFYISSSVSYKIFSVIYKNHDQLTGNWNIWKEKMNERKDTSVILSYLYWYIEINPRLLQRHMWWNNHITMRASRVALWYQHIKQATGATGSKIRRWSILRVHILSFFNWRWWIRRWRWLWHGYRPFPNRLFFCSFKRIFHFVKSAYTLVMRWWLRWRWLHKPKVQASVIKQVQRFFSRRRKV